MISNSSTTPRIIIHGGAGNISRSSLTPSSYATYRASMLSILQSSSNLLYDGSTSLEVATHAVTLLEDTPLFNCGKGAVFTRAGTNELEASVMVSRGYRKRGVAVSLLKHVKNPIRLAKEMLVRGETDGSGIGAQGHSHISGDAAERLAKDWALEMCDEKYFWTRKRWQEHQKGLERPPPGIEFDKDQPTSTLSGQQAMDLDDPGDPSWDGHEYLPQGTVGCVVLDKDGTLCVATSTGGLTNKLPGRIGDTPTLGAGFWAEEWTIPRLFDTRPPPTVPILSLACSAISEQLRHVFGACLPTLAGYVNISAASGEIAEAEKTSQGPIEKQVSDSRVRGVALSGTGNGDSFLRLAAVHSAAVIPRLVPSHSLAAAVKLIAGPGGALQQSAGDHWGKTGEGEGGMIGIEYIGGEGKIVANFNCGGMFRAWIDDDGKPMMRAFRGDYEDEQLDRIISRT